nr:IclR family transcriptional regulator [Neoroseomonas terrae]
MNNGKLGHRATPGQRGIVGRTGEKEAGASGSAQEAGDPLHVEAIARAFRVLEVFSTGAQPRSLGELAAASGLPKSAVQRVVHTLVRLGYMEVRPRGGHAPGRKLLDRSFDYQRSEPMLERAIPVLIDLQRAIGERVDLALLDDLTMLYVWRLESRRETFRAGLGGRRIPAWCSSGGIAVLSRLPEKRVDDVLARSQLVAATPFTLTDPVRIRERIAETRRLGYALLSQELQIGIIALAAPIVQPDGGPMAAVHITARLADVDEETARRRLAPALMEAANAIGDA